jgi:beta-glucosidase-like glycosyl hydrolase
MSVRRIASIILLSSVPAAVPGWSADADIRIDALLARMTLAEKLGQLSQFTAGRSRSDAQLREDARAGRWGSLMNLRDAGQRAELQRIALHESRLGIPLIFARDVIHGYRTVFPIPLGQSASWDPELVRKASHIAARETAADGIHWTFAPMLDIARDPRWGRIAESLGEDPVLASALAAAMVRGLQGESLDAPDAVAACAKHYAGYGAAEGGRDYNTTWIPETLLRDVYLPSFAAAEKAGVATFMSGFNALNGVPASANAFLLRQVLRKEWGFDGFVVSDWNAVEETINHGYAADSADAAAKSLGAGVDMEMASTDYYDHLPALIAAGKFDVKLVDEAVRNILRIKFRLGLFDKPIPPPPPSSAMLAPDALDLARQLATESAVLLRNEGSLLPLSKSIARAAVIGPLADSPVDQMGCWVRDAMPGEVRTPPPPKRPATPMRCCFSSGKSMRFPERPARARRSICRAPAHVFEGRGPRRCGALRLASRDHGRPRHRKSAVRRCRAFREADRQFPARHRPDSHLLQPHEHRPAFARRRGKHNGNGPARGRHAVHHLARVSQRARRTGDRAGAVPRLGCARFRTRTARRVPAHRVRAYRASHSSGVSPATASAPSRLRLNTPVLRSLSEYA